MSPQKEPRMVVWNEDEWKAILLNRIFKKYGTNPDARPFTAESIRKNAPKVIEDKST